MIIAVVSFWDEHPDDLRTMIGSLDGLCSRAVFLDGRYRLFPTNLEQADALDKVQGGTLSNAQSPLEQYEAILQACRDHQISCALEQPVHPFEGNEVAKRAHLFELAKVGTTREDWFLRIDPDEHVTHHHLTAALLAATDRDVAEVAATGISASEVDRRLGVERTWSHRALFRALPGLTCEGLHWRYTDGDRDLWGPGQHQAPALDLTEHLTITHRPRVDLARSERAAAYYAQRDFEGFER